MKFEFIAEPSIDSIIAQLKRFGVALVPGFIDKEEIEGLNSEFFRALGSEEFASVNNRSQHPVNHQGKTARIETSHEKAMVEFPVITRVFGGELMGQVSEAYFSPNDYSFNEVIFKLNLYCFHTQHNTHLKQNGCLHKKQISGEHLAAIEQFSPDN